MAEDNFDELSLEESCAHKNWKVRINGYDRAANLFRSIVDEQSTVWSGFVKIVECIVTDKHDPALEKGLEVVLIFVEKSPDAGKTVGQVIPYLVKKCIASPRARTRELAEQICLMYVEIEKTDVILGELFLGTGSKNPKISSACIHVVAQIIQKFGPKGIDVNLVLCKVLPLMDDRDKNVRNEVKLCIADLYRWLGSEIRPYLDQLKPPKLSEVVMEIAKISDIKPVPTRVFRFQKTKINFVEEETPIPIENENLQIPVIDFPDPLTPVEILCQIPSEFHSLIISRKWTDRKVALELLDTIISPAKKIKNEDFTELITRLINIISKDTNIVVVCLAIKCMTTFARGLGTEFTPHGSVTFKVLLDKLKEKKQNVVTLLREALDAVYKAVPLELISSDLIEFMGHKNPQVKCEVASFLLRSFSDTSSVALNGKFQKPLMSSLVLLLTNQDPHVRDSAAKTLGVLQRVASEKNLLSFLTNVDKQKLEKIRKYANYSPKKTFESLSENIVINKVGTENPDSTARARNKLSYPLSNNNKTLKNSNKREDLIRSETTSKIHNQVIPKLDIKKNRDLQLPEDMTKAISHDNWSIRWQAILDLQQFVDSLPPDSPNLGEIIHLLSSRIVDSNSKIAEMTLSLIKALTEKIGPSFKKNISILLPSLLKGMGDSKKFMKNAVIDCMNSIGKMCGYSDFFNNDILCDFLKSGPQAARVELWNWIAEKLDDLGSTDISDELLVGCLPSLYASMDDRNSEVRNSACSAIGGFTKIVGLETVISTCQRFRGGPNNSLIKIVLEKSENKILQSGTFSSESMPEVSSNHSHKKILTISSLAISPGVSSEPSSPLMDINNLKHQRVIDEQKRKIIKWEFTSPRTEFVELLQSLMSTANFNKRLINYMFHSDFKNHITAVELLTEEITNNAHAVSSNLDLILRWMTLRFFDSNPVVLSKCLDFLIIALEALKNTDYCMLDSEASAFIPYLILKLSDPRDNVQMKVKEILQKTSSVYPVSKLKKFVMAGIRTKSSRQKVNCLEVIKSFIDSYGAEMYLKELDSMVEGIAKLLSDRESQVKRIAFSVSVSLFVNEGEKLFALIDKYCEKDGKCIEQRIRKCASSRHASGSTLVPSQKYSSQNIAVGSNKIASPTNEHSSSTNIVNLGSRELNKKSESDSLIGMFKIDKELQEEVDSISNAPTPSPNLIELNLGFLDEKNSNLRSFPKHTLDSSEFGYISANLTKLWIENIINDDISQSINFMEQLDSILSSGKPNYLLDEVDTLARHIGQQLRKLSDCNSFELAKCYESVLKLLMTLISSKQYICRFSRATLRNLLEQVLSLISSNKFNRSGNENYRKAVNIIILKILENGGKTDLVCCLLEMLAVTKGDTIVSGKLHELCLKCLWRLNRTQPMWDSELNYSEIFTALEHYLCGYGFPWWKLKNADSALRTIKAILRSMVKSRGERILNDVEKRLNLNSGLYIYVRKLLKHLMTSGKPVNDGADTLKRIVSKHHLSISHALQLSSIFEEIVVNTSDGLTRLSNFTAQHPEIDLNGILSIISPEFLKYIASVSGKGGNQYPKQTSNNIEHHRSNFSKDAQNMWNRLKILQDRIMNLHAP